MCGGGGEEPEGKPGALADEENSNTQTPEGEQPTTGSNGNGNRDDSPKKASGSGNSDESFSSSPLRNVDSPSGKPQVGNMLQSNFTINGKKYSILGEVKHIDENTNTIDILSVIYPVDGTEESANSLGFKTLMRIVFPKYFSELRDMGYNNLNLEWDRAAHSTSALPGKNWRWSFNLNDPRWDN